MLLGSLFVCQMFDVLEVIAEIMIKKIVG